MGRHANPHRIAGPVDQLLYGLLQRSEGLGGIGRMRPEYFLVDDATTTQVGQRVDHGSAVSRVRHRRDAPTPPIPYTLPGGFPERLHCQFRLGIPHMLNPLEEVVLLDPATQGRQLQMGVKVHQARHQEGIGQFDGAGPLRLRNLCGRSDLCDPTVFTNENGPVDDYGAGHGIDGSGGDLQQISDLQGCGGSGRSSPLGGRRPSC